MSDTETTKVMSVADYVTAIQSVVDPFIVEAKAAKDKLYAALNGLAADLALQALEATQPAICQAIFDAEISRIEKEVHAA